MTELRVQVETLERGLLDGVQAFAGEPDRQRLDLGLIPVFSDERPLLGLAGLIDWRCSGKLSALVRSGLCTSDLGEQVLLPGDRRLPVDRLVLVGLGPRDAYDEERARRVGEQMVKISRGLGARNVLIALSGDGLNRRLVEATFEGLVAAIEGERSDGEIDKAPLDAVDPLDAEEPLVSEPPDVATEQLDAGTEPAVVDSTEPDTSEPHEVATHEVAPPSQPEIDQVSWWIAADEAVVARLRRVLSGPPRAARGGSGLHT